MRVALAILTVSLVLSGCAGPAPEDTHEPARAYPFDAMPLAAVGVDEENAEETAAGASLTKDDWLVLPLEASAEGGIAGYRFPIPDGSRVDAWYGRGEKHVVIEAAIVGSGDIEAFHLLVGQDGKVLAETTMFRDNVGGGGGVNEKSYSRIYGMYLFLNAEEGDDLFVAAAAIGLGDATVGLRFLAEDPVAKLIDGGDYEAPARDGDEFLDRVEGSRGVFVEPTGRAVGAHVGFLWDYHSLILPYSAHFRHGDIQVDQPVPGDLLIQPVTLITATASSPAGPGYSSQAVWTWNEVHAGLVEATLVTPDGTETAIVGPVVPDPIVNSNIALARGEGDGASSLSFSLKQAGTPTLFPQLVLVAYLRFDAPLSSLVGEAVGPQSLAYDALPVFVAGSVFLKTGAGVTSIQVPLA